jgi:class 3 adenylate cyclase
MNSLVCSDLPITDSIELVHGMLKTKRFFARLSRWMNEAPLRRIVLAAMWVCFASANLVFLWLNFASFAWLAWFGLILGCVSCVEIFNDASLLRKRKLEQALQGKVPPDTLERIVESPTRSLLAASEQVVTLMFIDIVGFARSSEAQSPREAFSNLQELLAALTKTVHRYGGIVDKSLGDGLLCYFGYYCQGMDWVSDHADRALECARQIQLDNVQRMIQSERLSKPIYPLRVGINSAAVYIGDVGYSDRIDFTVIGHGVNHAQRLEAACDSNLIMLGGSTRDLMTRTKIDENQIKAKLVQVKHHEELIEAFEYNPFFDRMEQLREATNVYRRFAGFNRTDTRWMVPEDADLKLVTDFGFGRLVNFSYSGFQIEFREYIAKGAKINLSFESQDEHMRQALAGMGLVPISVEVRWASAKENGCVHGCVIRNLNETKQRYLFTTLKSALSRVEDLRRAA